MFTHLRYSFHALLRAGSFTGVVISVLTLGIGANTAIFSVIYQTLLQPLPYGRPDRLVMIWETNRSAGEGIGARVPVARKNFEEWRRQNNVFEHIEAFDRLSFTVTGNSAPDRVKAAEATPEFFQTLRVIPKFGRTFLADEDLPGKNHIAILSYPFFRTHFPKHTSIVGQSLTLDSVPYEIVGVLPEAFKLTSFYEGRDEYKPEIWVPMARVSPQDSPMQLARRWLLVIARLKDGINPFQARANMTAISQRLAHEDPKLDAAYGANVFPISIENEDPSVRRALYLMFAAVLFVLLIACANLANLMLARGMRRQKEFAIKMAFGATTHTILTSILLESFLLALVGGTLGMILAYGGIHFITALKPADIHSIDDLQLSMPAAFFNLALTLLSISIFGLLPGWLVVRRCDVADILKAAGDRTTAAELAPSVRRVLVLTQVAIAVLLTTGSTLTIRSFLKLLRVDPGLHTEGLLTARIVLPVNQYQKPETRIDFSRRLLQNVRSLPGIDSASLIDNLPLYKIRYTYFQIDGHPSKSSSDMRVADTADATPGFLETMGVQLKSGRPFTEADTDPTSNVILINQTMAQRYWPGQDPLQQHIREMSVTGEPGPLLTVIGVIADYHQQKIETPVRPQMFRASWNLRAITILARTRLQPLSLIPSLQHAVWNIDKDQPLSDIQTMDEVVAQDISQRRFNMLLLSIFAGVALFIAIVGVYGLVSYIVTSRYKEIGIRIALGSQRNAVLLWLSGRIFTLAILGVLVGLVLSFSTRRFIATLLFGISVLDPTAYITVPFITLAIAIIASLVPAWTACKMDPAMVLRKE